jgi:hypothetical protein
MHHFGGWVPGPNVALFTVSILGTTMTSDSLALVPLVPLGSAAVSTPGTVRNFFTVALAYCSLTNLSIGEMTPAGTPPASSSW